MEHLLLGSTKEDSVCTYLACLYLRCITETRCQDQRSLTSQHSSLSAASSAPDSTEKTFLGSMLRASEDCWKSDLFSSGRLQAEPCGWQLLSRLASGQTKSWSLATTTWARWRSAVTGRKDWGPRKENTRISRIYWSRLANKKTKWYPFKTGRLSGSDGHLPLLWDLSDALIDNMSANGAAACSCSVLSPSASRKASVLLLLPESLLLCSYHLR